MEADPIAEAAKLTEAVAELLQRAVAIHQTHGHDLAEVRYAEALARTLLDQLSGMLHVPPTVGDARPDGASAHL
ncbi:MAG: hypothetical protein ACRELB_10370 [Polyangiaceae bacterium]